MALIIPLSSDASQQANVTLAGQPCSFWLRQLATGLYLDFLLNNTPIISGILCRDRTPLINDPTSPLNGDLIFRDMQATQDPFYTGLGTRFFLFFEAING